ncbi:MAG: flagellar export chaperone FliS [Gammaproteobacteria bacterium]
MTHNNAMSAVDQYAQLGLRTDIETATPHRIILLLLDGAIEKLRTAKMAMEQGRIAEKGAAITWSISIIDGLRASLDLERGGELAANLDNLYEYMARTLTVSNLHNDPGKLDEVGALLGEIRAGWKGIEDTVGGDAPVAGLNEVGPTAVGMG